MRTAFLVVDHGSRNPRARGVRFAVTEPLGFDPAIAPMVEERVRAAMACCPDHGPAARRGGAGGGDRRAPDDALEGAARYPGMK